MDKKKQIKKSTGRTKCTIDWTLVDEYLEAGATGTSIAATLGIHPETLYDKVVKERNVAHFSDYLQEKRAKGDSNIHLWQYKSAKRGNIQMLIWLGKNRLGQKDKSPEEVASNVSYNIVIHEIP